MTPRCRRQAGSSALSTAAVTTPYAACGTRSAAQSPADQVRGSVTPNSVIGTLPTSSATVVATTTPTAGRGRQPAARTTPRNPPAATPAASPLRAPSPESRFCRASSLPGDGDVGEARQSLHGVLGGAAGRTRPQDHVRVRRGVERGGAGRTRSGAEQCTAKQPARHRGRRAPSGTGEHHGEPRFPAHPRRRRLIVPVGAASRQRSRSAAAWRRACKEPHPRAGVGLFRECLSGGVLLSHTVPSAVPSALKGLASGFGMGPGVSPSL